MPRTYPNRCNGKRRAQQAPGHTLAGPRCEPRGDSVGGRNWIAGLVATLVASLALATAAFAHVERTAFWPDPKPDTSSKPAAGGKVPKVRTLASALKTKPPGTTRVVCQKDSLKLLKAQVKQARKNGVNYRPTETRSFSAKQGKRLLALNKKLFKRCKFGQIQPAVTKSHNNDRIVIMPGVYSEPK